MKTTTQLTCLNILILLLTVSCGKEELPPEACFTTSTTNPTEGETVLFSDCSSNAGTYSWNFGDGGTSNEANPRYSYDNGGRYDVILKVANDEGSDRTTVSVNVKNYALKATELINYSDTFSSGNGSCTRIFLMINNAQAAQGKDQCELGGMYHAYPQSPEGYWIGKIGNTPKLKCKVYYETYDESGASSGIKQVELESTVSIDLSQSTSYNGVSFNGSGFEASFDLRFGVI